MPGAHRPAIDPTQPMADYSRIHRPRNRIIRPCHRLRLYAGTSFATLGDKLGTLRQRLAGDERSLTVPAESGLATVGYDDEGGRRRAGRKDVFVGYQASTAFAPRLDTPNGCSGADSATSRADPADGQHIAAAGISAPRT